MHRDETSGTAKEINLEDYGEDEPVFSESNTGDWGEGYFSEIGIIKEHCNDYMGRLNHPMSLRVMSSH